ncbi:MAG: phosphatase [Ignavibacteria bacterium RBG_16_34_14]|nr:MAG: phosphatase [Ignavibacteria bacterium RBG_16_34_14]
MKNFEGIIFDVDGTIASTIELIHASFNHITSKYLNKKLTKEEVIALFGPTEDAILKEWFGDNFENAIEDYYKFYKDEHNLAAVYPGIKELLRSIKEKNIPIGIFTGKGRRTTLITLEVLGLDKYFDLIVTGDDVKEHKPSGEGIIKFINAFGLNKEKVLMIGDSVGDIKAAREAGVKIASVVWDKYVKEEVLKQGSDYLFHSVDELKEFLETNL